jgi:hypothetical protein
MRGIVVLSIDGVIVPNTRAKSNGLLDAVRRMTREEFDDFLAQASSSRAPLTGATLSSEETRLIRRINRGLSKKWHERHARLTHRRKNGCLSSEEHQELLRLTHEAESRDAERAAALVELADLRHLPLRVLMKQMGISVRPIHG